MLIAFLGGHDLVAVLEGPGAERVDRAEQRPSQSGQLVLDAGRRLGVGIACDQSVELQPPQRLGQDLGADAPDALAQFARALGTTPQHPDQYGVPGVGEEVEREAGTAVGEIGVGRHLPHGARRGF